ncbi:MAG TPA: S8 family serine peptidase [Actinomycetota bacterium]|nr:S8 family serine peptidase [Actinomycetota bacterium]
MLVAQRRRVLSTSVLALLALAASLLPASALAAGPAAPAPVDRQVLNAGGRTGALVHVAEGAALRDGLAAARSAGLETGATYDAIDVFVAYGSPAEFETVAASGDVEYVEANRRIQLFTNTSHQATRGQTLLDGGVTLPDGTVIDGSGVGVAVVDSGVDGTHPDLAPNLGGNVEIVCTAPQFVASGALGGFTECLGPKQEVELEDTDTTSAGGHGTHVAGTIAGTGGAFQGRWHGAAPGATIYGVSIGTGDRVENAMDGLAWVLHNRNEVTPAIKVVNNSWGSGYRKYSASGDVLYSSLWKMQEALINAGVTVVYAAGNGTGNGTTPTTSAECVNPTPGVICVANYDDKNNGTRAGTIESTSSRGKANEPESWPDVSAPGTQIVATCRLTLPICNAHGGMILNPPNLYSTLSGTSMAAPHVSGIVAQLYQADPTLTPAEVENVLEDTAHKFAWGSEYGLFTDPTNPDDTSSFEKGHGLVDALAAVQSVLGGSTDPTAPPTTSPEPTATPTATPTPTAPPSEPPTGGGTRYYFHSLTGIGNADKFMGAATFDTNPPTLDGYSEAHDLPGTSGAPQAIYDPSWTGTVDSTITSITLDFWAKTPVGDVLNQVDYDPTIWVGDTAYPLPTLTADPSAGNIGNVPSRLTKTYTTMLDASGNQVPLSIDPAGQPVSISIAGRFAVDEAGSYIVYDSTEYPSGFVIGGGSSATPTPSPTPTVDPTTEPTPPPGGRGTYPVTPDDSLFGDQWGMAKIQAPQAWQERNATGFGINLAVVDSGLDLGHEDFACSGKLEVLPGSNIGSSSNPNSPQDTDGHGTHVAGIAGACTDNGKGVVGVAPDATIMPVRVFDEPDLDKAMADGIRFATDNGAHVINLSIGDIPPFSHFGPDLYPQTEEALAHARDNGVVIAAAAGNFTQPTCEYPSLSRNVICVVATDRDDMRSYYSDFPVNVDRNADEPKIEPVVAAPGGQGTFCEEGIVSTFLRTNDSTCHTAGYDSLDGTSMSSPHVAGIAALLYDRLGGERSKANADLIVQTILDTSDDLYTPGWDPIVGYGRVNALSAVRAIEVPEPAATSVTFTDNTSETAQYSDEARLEALLTNSVTNEPIAGTDIVFEVAGAAGITHELVARTNDEGVAGVTFAVTEKPGTYNATARFLGEEELLLPSADIRTFAAEREATTLTLVVDKAKSSGKTATATLTDTDATGGPLAGQVVEFFAGGESVGTATTDASGIATIDVRNNDAPGHRTITAVFAGTDFYGGSSAEGSA